MMETPTDLSAVRLAALTREFDELRLSTPKSNGEPEWRELADDPARPVKPLIQAYLEGIKLTTQQARPVFYAEVPPPPANGHTPSITWMLKALLQQWGDPAWERREDASSKRYRLERYLEAAQVRLLIIGDVHHLILKNGTALSHHVEWLLSLCKSRLTVPLVIVGEPERLQKLICSSARFCWRFWPIRLPGDPEPKKDPEAEKHLRALLGIPEDSLDVSPGRKAEASSE